MGDRRPDRDAVRGGGRCRRRVDHATGPGPTPTLDRLVRAHVGVVTEDVQRASVFVHEWRALAEERRTAIAGRRDAYEARFRAVIDDGVAARRVRAVDPMAAARPSS